MQTILDLVNEPHVPWMLVLIALLNRVGVTMVRDAPKQRAWGERIAGAAFCAYCAYAISSFGPISAEDFVWIVVRGLLACGVVLGSAWIVLAVEGSVYDNAIAPVLASGRLWAARIAVERAMRRYAAAATKAELRAKRQTKQQLLEEVTEVDKDFELRIRTLREIEMPEDARQIWETKLTNERINELGRRLLGRRK